MDFRSTNIITKRGGEGTAARSLNAATVSSPASTGFGIGLDHSMSCTMRTGASESNKTAASRQRASVSKSSIDCDGLGTEMKFAAECAEAATAEGCVMLRGRGEEAAGTERADIVPSVEDTVDASSARTESSPILSFAGMTRVGMTSGGGNAALAGFAAEDAETLCDRERKSGGRLRSPWRVRAWPPLAS
jgi:hypothetical protein